MELMKDREKFIGTLRLPPQTKQVLREMVRDANMTLTDYLCICGLDAVRSEDTQYYQQKIVKGGTKMIIVCKGWTQSLGKEDHLCRRRM